MEPRLPFIHVVKVEDNTVSVVSSPICDFCGDAGPKWDYGCEDFYLAGMPSPFVKGASWASTGDWCACEECARLIDGRLLPELSARQIKLGIPPDWSARILQGFFDFMTGEKVPFG